MGALKTFYGVMANWNGEAMDALITQENRSSILNNPGDQVSVGALELITFQSTFDLLPGVDVYEVTLVKRSDHAIYMANARGKIYIPADVVGDYEIDSVGALNKQGFDAEAQYAPETRSVDDTNAVTFFWETNPSSITGEVQFTDDDVWQPVVGAITFVAQYGTRYAWTLPYNAANKPDGEGFARFRLTDSTGRVHHSQVNYFSNVAALTLLPGMITAQSRTNESVITVVVGESVTATHLVVDADGNPFDMTGLTMKLYIDDAKKQRITSVTPIIDTTSFTAVLPVSVTEVEKMFRFGLWDETNSNAKRCISSGRIDTRYAPGPLSVVP